MQRAQTRSRVEQAQLLLDLARRVTGTLDLQEVLNETFSALRALIVFGGGAIQLVDDDALVAAATDPPATAEALTVRIPIGQGISGSIAANGEAIYIPDIWADRRVHPEGKKKGVSSGVSSYFGVPLIMHGRPMGVLQIDSPDEDAFDEEDRATLLAFAPTVASAVQNAQLFEAQARVVIESRETEQMKRDFLAIASHELRTPITSMGGFGITLAHHAASLDPDTVADIGQRIWRATRRLERVMGEILDLSKMQSGGLTVEIAPTAVEWILREIEHEQSDDDHPITVEVQPGLPRAFADAARLHQVIGNLVGNARKFSPSGAPIALYAERADDRIAIHVTDHGGGVPGHQRERIFEPFVQFETENTRTREGLGVGLYIARALCERMNAELNVSNVPGGARFTVSLPLAG